MDVFEVPPAASATPGKRATRADVARAAGVSPTTVSFVLNDTPGQLISTETRDRVLEAARDLDYRPHSSARALAAGRSDIVLLSLRFRPLGGIIADVMHQIADELENLGLTLITHLADTAGRTLPDVCAAVNAFAVISFDPLDAETIAALRRARADVVIGPELDPRPLIAMGAVQAEYLIDRGHRRIGYALPEHPGFQPTAEPRLAGATEACAHAGLEPPVAVEVGADPAAVARAVAELTAANITGICAYNDDVAFAVLAGMRSLRLTAPDDIAVIGFDDTPAAALWNPALTTIRLDLVQAGQRLAEMVAAGLAGREPVVEPDPTRLRVIEREST